MASWKAFAEAAPELAAWGKARFDRHRVAYLATARKDGSPRVHPVTPIISGERLFLFMEPTSPKGHDLRRDGRYALHSLVTTSSGDDGEFIVTGRADFIDDPALRQEAIDAASYSPADRYVLFELGISSARSTEYKDGQPIHKRWKDET